MDGDKDSLLLDEGFSFLIAVRLIRNNWKAVIENYPTSLIGEIWFDLQVKQLLPTFLIGEIWFDVQDKQLLENIILSLLVRFGLIYKISSYWEISYFPYWRNSI